jgi:polyvinyl alcohol dehydrogenase (cytochrome)
MNSRLLIGGAASLAVVSLIGYLAAQSGSSSSSDWVQSGQGLSNLRYQSAEQTINPQNALLLNTKWMFTTGGDVSATPTVAAGVVYVPDWAGNLFAIRAADGQMIWSHQISDYDHVSGAYARVSPAVYQDEIIIGDIGNGKTTHDGANVIAIGSSDGSLRWITKVENHPAAIITGSPVVFGDTVYVGVSSNEEGLADTARAIPAALSAAALSRYTRQPRLTRPCFDRPGSPIFAIFLIWYSIGEALRIACRACYEGV